MDIRHLKPTAQSIPRAIVSFASLDIGCNTDDTIKYMLLAFIFHDKRKYILFRAKNSARRDFLEDIHFNDLS
jgi:hypothetical protein